MKSLLINLTVVFVALGVIVANGVAEETVNLTSGELANALRYLFQKDMKDFLKGELFKDISKAIKTPEIFKKEVYFLKLFAFDTGIKTSKHEELPKGMVRRAFLNEVSELDFYLQYRSDAYTIAFTNASHHLGAPYAVVRQFMDFCGYRYSAVIMSVLGEEFMSSLRMVNEFMNSVRIVTSNP